MNETVTTTNENDVQMDIQIVEYNGVRVITTKQAAKIYETTTKKISNNFNANRKRYTEGKHYFLLEGKGLQDFRQNDDLSRDSGLLNRTPKLYLWTERGALLLAKSINTDVAWTAYERLVDFYFDKKESYSPAPEPDELPQNPHRTSNTPVPRNVSWYQRNSRRMGAICEKAQISRKTLYHHILVRLGEEYDIAAANRIYTQENGYPPKYAIDIVSYFPELAALADEYLDVIEFM